MFGCLFGHKNIKKHTKVMALNKTYVSRDKELKIEGVLVYKHCDSCGLEKAYFTSLSDEIQIDVDLAKHYLDAE